ncbi:MAG: Ig-like domain-containing protein [Fibromonadales bacterium]|nr:Ig-like domain-containing protein [Fibromonadales bacterium]
MRVENKHNILLMTILRMFASEKVAYGRLIILVQTIISCATVVPPSGGPEDKLPPRVNGTTLAPNSVNQSVNLDLTLQFDEWIVQKPPTGAVAISPPVAGRLRLKADGDKLRIYSTEPLDSNTTYMLTVTNAIKDLRNNPLEKPFQILFSTGPTLDSLKIDFFAWLHDSLIVKKKFPVVALYPIGKTRATKSYLAKFRDSTLTAETDTIPNIIKEIPQYFAQTDSLGKGTLFGIQKGSYLAVAFLDENNNQKLDIGGEITGIAPFPFNLAEGMENTPLLKFSLGDLDTSSFSLDAVLQKGNKEIEFSFSRRIILDSLFVKKSNCLLSTAKDTVFSSDFYMASAEKITFVFDDLKNDTLYTARCSYAMDSLGRNLDSARNSAKFRFKKIPDNEIASTFLSKTEPASASEDFLPERPLKIYYNRPISIDTLGLRLFVNEDSVAMDAKRIDAANFEISSNPKWKTDSKIKLSQMKKDTLVDTLPKEKILLQFGTIQKLKLASLKGEIPGGNAQTIVILQETLNSKSRRTLQTREFRAQCNSAGYFEIKDLPAGIYRLLYFKDLNGDGRLTSGSIYPLQAGEPWAAPAENLILPRGDDNFLKELLKDLPSL